MKVCGCFSQSWFDGVKSQSHNQQPEKTANIYDATTGFPGKWHLRNGCSNSILMTHRCPGLGSDSDWSCREGNLLQPISSSTTQIWVVMRLQYGISALVS